MLWAVRVGSFRPYELVGAKAFALRRLTAYDAAHVALAFALQVPFVTLDRSLAPVGPTSVRRARPGMTRIISGHN
jgi:predicted nucleic acid-binding protein